MSGTTTGRTHAGWPQGPVPEIIRDAAAALEMEPSEIVDAIQMVLLDAAGKSPEDRRKIYSAWLEPMVDPLRAAWDLDRETVENALAATVQMMQEERDAEAAAHEATKRR